jgi:hypothetical protein
MDVEKVTKIFCNFSCRGNDFKEKRIKTKT